MAGWEEGKGKRAGGAGCKTTRNVVAGKRVPACLRADMPNWKSLAGTGELEHVALVQPNGTQILGGNALGVGGVLSAGGSRLRDRPVETLRCFRLDHADRPLIHPPAQVDAR